MYDLGQWCPTWPPILNSYPAFASNLCDLWPTQLQWDVVGLTLLVGGGVVGGNTCPSVISINIVLSVSLQHYHHHQQEKRYQHNDDKDLNY